MNPHFFTAPFFDWRDRRSDRETQTLWILEVLHGRMTKGGNASSHSFSIRSGSRLLLAFPLGEGGPRQRWIGCSR